MAHLAANLVTLEIPSVSRDAQRSAFLVGQAGSLSARVGDRLAACPTRVGFLRPLALFHQTEETLVGDERRPDADVDGEIGVNGECVGDDLTD